MGAVFTQRPELVAAVASFVGIYDMLRVESEPNGVFNTTEFGSVKDKAQFEALFAYSPYHHVKDGTAYPPTLFLIGKNDVRVAPWHSRKMTARLQAASSSTSPILLATTKDAGHGIGSGVDTIVAQNTDAFGFLLSNLGVTYAASAPAPTPTATPAAAAPK
jgi:prolyl oligopeptidase